MIATNIEQLNAAFASTPINGTASMWFELNGEKIYLLIQRVSEKEYYSSGGI